MRNRANAILLAQENMFILQARQLHMHARTVQRREIRALLQTLRGTNGKMRPHFRYRKVTPDLLKFMRLLRGYRLGYAQIAGVCQVDAATVQYHLNPRTHERILARARRRLHEKPQKKRDPARTREWTRQYLHQRYHEDPVFRAKTLRANTKGGKFSGSLK